MQKRILLALLLILPLLASAQRNKRYRWEFGVDLGASNFLGDLGGANQIGTHFVKDLELRLTGPAVGIHVRHRFNRYWGVRSNFGYGHVSGDDALTTERYRHNRNLNFKTNIWELSVVGEFYFSKERPGHIYNYKKLKGWRHIDIQSYLFFGVGGFYFNPKAEYQGVWYKLRPLHTEGLGIATGTKNYSRFVVCLPMGAGFKYAINRRWNIGLEYGLRLTFSDYMDDCSSVYFDPATLSQQLGADAPIAIHFANPGGQDISAATNGGIDPTWINQQRGDTKHKDAYMFLQVTVNYKIGKFRKTHSKF